MRVAVTLAIRKREQTKTQTMANKMFRVNSATTTLMVIPLSYCFAWWNTLLDAFKPRSTDLRASATSIYAANSDKTLPEWLLMIQINKFYHEFKFLVFNN